MRIDIITIFPDYFTPLGLSLLGRATQVGLLQILVHDLRAYTRDRHRTVDDGPYGGGAGMLMLPQPWGEALDAVLAMATDGALRPDRPQGAPDEATHPVLVLPSPAGERFTQAMARDLAGRSRLVFGCGRYEGIDARVALDAAHRFDVREVSLGDYVLNGGEVAALAMIEAIARLVPGVIGNPESLAEESHNDGLLECPGYTRPPVWRGLAVPAVLLSGDHAAIARWRREQSQRRTRERRPDLWQTEPSV